MYYVGVDLHKKSSYFCILNDQGEKIMLKNVTNDESSLRGFMASIPQPFTLAFESTFNWYFFADLAHQFTDSVLMAKPFELKAFAKQHKKNDKIDAQLIASVLFRGFLPTATIADQYTREVRELLRSRITLVSDRSRNIIRLKNFMDKIGRPIKTTLTAHNHLQAINTDHLPLIYVKVINDYKERIHFLNLKLSGIKNDITTIITADRDMIHLQTIPGIGFFSAALIKSEIMDISRFKSFNRLCAGDRNTLALAFYFASLEQETDLSTVVAVIDDPVSSLDDGRTLTTSQEIRELSTKVCQLLLFSHSKRTLCSVWKHADHQNCSSYTIIRGVNGSTFDVWNVSEEAITEYDRQHEILRNYNAAQERDVRKVARGLRYVLEGFLRVACTEHFPPGELIGNFIRRERQLAANGDAIVSKEFLRELESITEYANKFHHDSNPNWDVNISNINEQELNGFVERALQLTKATSSVPTTS